MLYDNGPLLRLYADAWLATGDPFYKRVVEETAEWVMREMQPPGDATSPISIEGGYYSTLDADSENEEGKFYIWDRDQVAQILSPEEYAVVAPITASWRTPNFEHKHWNLEIVAAACGSLPWLLVLLGGSAAKACIGAQKTFSRSVNYAFTRAATKKFLPAGTG